MARLLLVDDDPKFLDVLSKLLRGRGFEISTSDNGAAALKLLAEQSIDLLVCDNKMSPMSGMELLKTVHERHANLPVIMLTAFGTVDTALESLRMGAFDYVTKPCRVQEFVESIERAIAWRSQGANDNAQPEIPYRLGNLVAQSPSMIEVCAMIERCAPTETTVLFRGERGVGKQLAGRAIHALSPRRDGPFVVADCAAPTPEELTRRLFGAVKGATSGLAEDVDGCVLQANGGTLWLSEIGAMPVPVQERLLRLLKEQRISPLGTNVDIDVNVRVLAETSMDIEKAVSQGRFRAPLFARFAPLAVEIKPLRTRREDIIPLAWHFCRQILGPDTPLPRIEPDARGLMLHYGWPGNVRELEDVIRGIMLTGSRTSISSRDLPEAILQSVSSAPQAGAAGSSSGRAKMLKAFLLSKEARRQAAKPS